MSCFIVTNDCINLIISRFPHDQNDIFYSVKEIHTTAQELGTAMYLMNLKAFHGRYAGKYQDEINLYKYVAKMPVTMMRTYKSLQCYLYQCAEDSTYKSDLYGYLTEVKARMANDITSSMPEYSEAGWE